KQRGKPETIETSRVPHDHPLVASMSEERMLAHNPGRGVVRDPSPDHEFMSRLGRGAFRPDRDGPAGIHEGRGFDRKLDDERVTGAPARLDTDSAAVQPRRPLHDREAETAARPIDLAGLRRPVEALEHAFALLCRERRRAIVNPKLDAPGLADD